MLPQQRVFPAIHFNRCKRNPVVPASCNRKKERTFKYSLRIEKDPNISREWCTNFRRNLLNTRWRFVETWEKVNQENDGLICFNMKMMINLWLSNVQNFSALLITSILNLCNFLFATLASPNLIFTSFILFLNELIGFEGNNFFFAILALLSFLSTFVLPSCDDQVLEIAYFLY